MVQRRPRKGKKGFLRINERPSASCLQRGDAFLRLEMFKCLRDGAAAISRNRASKARIPEWRSFGSQRNTSKERFFVRSFKSYTASSPPFSLWSFLSRDVNSLELPERAANCSNF